MPVATAAAAPPLEPPGVRFGSQGLSVRPCSALSVKYRVLNAGTLVRPTKMAPAFRHWMTHGLSSLGTLSLKAPTPLVVGRPATSTLIFSVTGTPCSGPSGAPFFTA